MKFCIYKKGLATICLLSFFVSCQESENFLATDEKCRVYFSVDKFIGDVSTRTNVDPANNYAITWADGDAIGVFPREGYQEPFEIPSGQIGLSKAQFDGGYWALKEGLTYNAYYPFDKANFESAEMKTQIPVTYLGQSQEGTACNVGAYDYTYSDWTVAPAEGSVSFKFHHIGAFAVFKLEYPQTATYTQLKISASDAVIPTTGSYDLTAETVALVPDEDALSTSIHLALENCSGIKGDTGTFYMMLPPMALESDMLSVILTDVDGTDYYLSTDIGSTFEAGKLYEVAMTEDILDETTMLLLPKGSELGAIVASAIGNYRKIKFVANSSTASETVLFADENGAKAYAVTNGEWFEIHTSKSGFLANADCSYMFNGYTYSDAYKYLNTIDFGQNFVTCNVTNMSHMFYSCEYLASLNLSAFDTRNVTDMNWMFGASFFNSLTSSSLSPTSSSLDLSNFDTRNVTNMSCMFLNCNELASLDLSSFDTRNVTDMSCMFMSCGGLTTLSLSSFDTRNVTNMNSMFSGCENLTSLDLSNFDTENVTDMGYMFFSCYNNLTSLDLSSFDTRNVTNMSNMFNDCRQLRFLNLSSFNTEKVRDMERMFMNIRYINALDLSGFSFAANPTVTYMLYVTGVDATSKPITIKVSSEGYTYLTSTTTDCGINSSYATLRSN